MGHKSLKNNHPKNLKAAMHARTQQQTQNEVQ